MDQSDYTFGTNEENALVLLSHNDSFLINDS